LFWLMRVRLAVFAVVTVLVWIWMRSHGFNDALAMIVPLVCGFAIAYALNIILVNTVFFRLTQEQIEIESRH